MFAQSGQHRCKKRNKRRRRGRRSFRKPRSDHKQGFRPQLELLEDRWLLAADLGATVQENLVAAAEIVAFDKLAPLGNDQGFTSTDQIAHLFASDNSGLRSSAAVGTSSTPQSQSPSGSLIYVSQNTGSVSTSGEVDSFTIDLDAGQSIAVVADPAASLQPTIELFDPGSSSLGNLTADGAGDDVVLQTFTTTSAGTYTVTVTGDAGSTGDYTLEILLNAARELEEHDGTTNDTLLTAQDLNATFVSLGIGAASRGGVIGSGSNGVGIFPPPSASPSEADLFYNPTTGELFLDSTDAPGGTFTGYVLETLQSPGFFEENHVPFLGGIGTTADDEISEANFFSSPGLFNIGAVMPTDLDQAAFEAFFSESIYTGQLGKGVSNFDLIVMDVPTTIDHYQFSLNAGESTALALARSGGGEISLELLDSAGNVLTSGQAVDNVDRLINDFVAPTTGTYYVRITSSVVQYSLAVTREAVFDSEANDALASSQDLGVAGTALGAIDTSDDFYHFEVNAGDLLTLSTATPADGPFEFSNTLDPALELYDPTGTPVATDSGSAADGQNALLVHSAGLSGTYTVRILAEAATTGEYALDVSGQTGSAAEFEVTSTDPADGALQVTPLNEVTVELSDAVRPTSVDAADLTIDGTPALAVTIVDADTLRFTLPATVDGLHDIAIAAGALHDLQDQPLAAFASQFTLDTVGPRVIDSSIQEGDSVAAGSLLFTVQFDRELDATNLDVSDVLLSGQLSGNHGASSLSYDSLTSTLSVSFDDLADDAYHLTLVSGDGAFEDLLGRDLDGEPLAFPLPPNLSGDGIVGGNFVVNFVTDQDVLPFFDPLQAVDPLGSQIYVGDATGVVRTAGDADSFTIDFDSGQAMTIVVDGDPSLQAVVEIRDPSNSVVQSATATATGETAVIQTAAVNTAGTYTVTISGNAATTGAYAIDLVLNAAVEEESHGGASNDTLANAQDLDSRFISFGLGTEERAGVIGSSDTSTNFVASQTQSDLVSYPNELTYDFGGGAMPAGDGVLTVTANADLNLAFEFLTIDAEGLFTQNLFMQDGLQGESVVTTVEISQADLAALAADGTITIDVKPNLQVNVLSSDELTLELVYPTYPATSDLYSFSLATGELASLALDATTAGHLSLELLDASGTLLTTGAVGENIDQVVDSFVATTAGTYYARVSGNVADYSLVVARGADFDTESNNGLGVLAQDLTASGTAFGGLFAGDVEPGRSFGLIQDLLPWLAESNNAIIEELGHDLTLIKSSDLGTTDLSTFDVIVLASDQGTATYTNVANNLSAVESFVDGGGVWVVNYAAGDVTLPYQFDVLPGAAGVVVEETLGPDINVLDPTSGLINGPGGTITDTNLDGGFWSIHGSTDSLPAGGNAILSSGDPSEVVAFDYPSVDGHVIVHTIPIEFYGGGPSTLGRTFHRNLFNYAASLASEVADHYRVEAVAGDVISVQTLLPASGADEFGNLLDVEIELYDPSGLLVASDPAGSLTHTAASTGTYTVRVVGEADSQGEYVIEVTGHSGDLPLFEVVASDPSDGGRVGVDTISVTLDLSDAMLLTSIEAGDLLIDGTIPAISVTAVDHDTLEFQLPALIDGLHTATIAAGAIVDLQGQPLESFSSELTIDTIAPQVIATSIEAGETLSARSLTYSVQFDEEISTAALNSFDLQLLGAVHGGHVLHTFDYDPVSSILTLEFINLPEDDYTLTLFSGDGSFEDLVGHDLDGEPNLLTTVPSGDDEAGGDFFFSFTNEYTSVPFPALLRAESPVGSLIYDSNVAGSINEAGDVDSYTLDVDAGQTVTIVLESDPALQANVELEDSESTPLISATASVAGSDAVLQTVTLSVAGSYTIHVRGAAGTTGDYSIRAILNAAVEAESHDGDSNNDILSAQDLTSSFLSLGTGSADRGAVVGNGGSDHDVYSFPLIANRSVTLALSARLAGGLTLELLDSGGSVLATGVPTAGNIVGRSISDFVVATTGTYFARVVGSETPYSLVVTRGADFDVESNDSPTEGQTTGSEQTALGYLFGEPNAELGEPTGLDAAENSDSPASPAELPAANDSVESTPNRLIVRFKEVAGLDVAATVTSLGGTLIEELPLINGAVVEIDPSLLPGTELPGTGQDGPLVSTADSEGHSTAALINLASSWQSNDLILYAEPDYVLQTQADPVLPNDLNLTALWGMHNVGQTGGTVDADIDAPEAWANFTGTTQVVIAGIDTGIDYNHEDLAANMWRNLAELNGTPGVDDDGNGFIDDIYGIDTANDDSDPFDDNGHGTHTAGTFGAVGNNGVGVVGANWDVQIMALKFLGSNGNGSISDAVEAIAYMTMMKTEYGVNIVASNNSWSGGGFSQALEDAIAASNEAGIMFVAAAANFGADNDEFAEYPANFDLDGIISVAATDDNDQLAGFSNFGANTVDLGAPGVFIWSTTTGNTYEYSSGTSMAAPHVTGAVAMLMATNPHASLAEVKNAILSGVDQVESLEDKTVTGGRLNLANSLALIGDAGDYYDIEVVAGDVLTISTATPGDGPLDFVNQLDPFVELYDPSGTLIGTDDNSGGDGVNARLEHTALTSGTYTVRVASSSGSGTYVVDIAAAPRVVGVEVNDKSQLSVGSIEGALRGITSIDVTFSRPVDFLSTDVLLERVTFSGNVETVTATLTPVAVEGSGSDTLTITFANGTVVDTWLKVTLLSDGIISTKNIALDGDAPAGGSGRGYLADASDLPSGDGVSGGHGVFFVGSLVGDANGDGAVNVVSDILPAFAAYTGEVGAAGGRTVTDGDIDEDGDVDVSDLLAMFSAYGNSLDMLPTLLPPPLLLQASRVSDDASTEQPPLATRQRQQAVDEVHQEVASEPVEDDGLVERADDDGDDPLDVDANADVVDSTAQDTAAVDATLESW